MKKNLLLLFACLFGALSGVKAWTSVDPVVNRWYLLYNINTHNYWYGTNATYGDVDNLANATPIKLESGYKLAFICGSTTYRIYHQNGTRKPERTDGVNFTLEGGATDQYGYRLKSKNTDYDRWMCPGGSFEQSKNIHDRDWQFFAYEEVLPSIVEAKAPTCASTAEASYVSGWEKVTTKEQLAQNPERYFYAIFSAVNPGVMLETYASGTYANRLCYRTATTPTSSWTTLYELEGKGEFFAFKSCATGNYFANSSGAPWDYFANVTEYNDNCKTTISSNSGAWTIQAANEDETQWRDPVYHGSYAGSWDNYEYVGERLAANKSIERAGYFLIYRKLKKNVDMTGLITNPSFETGDLTGWNAPGRNDTGAKENSDNTYKISNGDAVDRSWLFNSWGGTEENSVSQTISLPKGTYRLSALLAGFTGETLTLSAGGQSSNVVVAGDKTYGYTVSVTFTLTETSDVTIKASNTKSQQTSDASFIKADNFRLTYLGVMATEADYTALRNAINNAEAKNLGFDNGEYAPYNNVAVLNALADANAIDPSADNLQIDVQNATNALTSKSWTANSGNVDAVFNGLFSSSEDGGLTGWTRTNAWGQQQTGLEGDYATAYYNHPGSLVYGSTDNYSMPLNADQVYKLTFAYRSHESKSNNSVTASINKKGGSAVFSKQYGANPSTTEWRVVTAFFTTQAAGDYVLTLANSGNTWITGVSIEKLPSTVPATIGANGYTTFASTYPLDLTQANLPFGVKAYKATSINSSYVHFEKLDQVVPANTGVLLEGTHGVHDIRVGSEIAEVTDNLFLVNESNAVFSPEDNTTYYAMVKNSDPMTFGKFDPSKVAVPFYKAYLKVNGGSQARLTVMFDGEDPTAINVIEAAEAEDGALKDGKYLIDGKIVIVKNGVKYSANGQKLN